ncbi:MAG TPA: hypothetical protein PK514_13590 [Spirochaetota bacterium]|nr:hypothetical protein [Spirochaetota bacterium]
MKKYILITLIIPICAASLHADAPTFDRIISDYNSIRTISASINQQVYMPGGEARYYSGDYSADSSGNLRIDYYSPAREIVINNSSGFYWYIPGSKTVYVKKGAHGDTGFPAPSLGKIIEGNAADLSVTYEGREFYSFFKRAAVFTIKSAKSPMVIRVWTDPGGLYVLRKYVLDGNGYEIIREIYSGHINTGGVYLPSAVEMFVRTGSGIVHSYTAYSNIAVNIKLNSELFVFKKDKDTAVRSLDEM